MNKCLIDKVLQSTWIKVQMRKYLNTVHRTKYLKTYLSIVNQIEQIYRKFLSAVNFNDKSYHIRVKKLKSIRIQKVRVSKTKYGKLQ